MMKPNYLIHKNTCWKKGRKLIMHKTDLEVGEFTLAPGGPCCPENPGRPTIPYRKEKSINARDEHLRISIKD